MGDCTYCGKSAGLLSKKHRECEQKNAVGYRQMVREAFRAAASPEFDEAQLHQILTSISEQAYIDRTGIRAAIAEGWRVAADASLRKGSLTEEDERRLFAFRDRLGIENSGPNERVATQLRRVAASRLLPIARQAASVGADSESRFQDLHRAFDGSSLSPDQQRSLLIAAWESSLIDSIGDGLLTLEEEQTLAQYLVNFNLSEEDLDTRGAYTRFVQAIVLREVAEGIVPQRANAIDLPVNLQKTEQLVWAINDVDYIEVETIREFRGGSQGIAIPVSKGMYYNPQQIRGQIHQRDETVHTGSGLLGITTKHIYFHGGGKSFRIPYEEIVSYQRLPDGFGLIRDGRDSKLERFKTGDGWFAYNLVTNLARL